MIKSTFNIYLLILYTALTSISISSIAQTTLPTTISTDYTLSKINSPYRVVSNVSVTAGAKLTVEPGVVVEFYEDAGLYVEGCVSMKGDAEDWIYLKTAPGHVNWGAITFEYTSDPSIMQYVEITGSTHGKDANRDRAAVNASFVAEVILDHVRIFNVASAVYFIDTNERCVFKDCYFKCDDRGSLFNLVRASALIEDCEFAGVVGNNSDAIDFDKVIADIIGNTVYGMTGSESDGIDIGSSSVVFLTDNEIRDCSDSGIEAEEESVILAERNVILDCKIGITVKQEASGTFINNTFYNNELCFSAYSETNTNGKGGTIIATNNIIAQSASNYYSRHGSSFTFGYNLIQSGSLPGIGNFNGDAGFVAPSSRDFHLQSNSPAIDAGDPNSPRDTDGTRADIGAFYYEQDALELGLVISEIHFNPIGKGAQAEAYEFIELYNSTNESISLSNYSLSGAIQLTFPEGASISADEYILVLANLDNYGDIQVDKFVWDQGNLGNSGDQITLNNSDGNSLAEVNYSVSDPWPKKTIVSDLSIELIDFEAIQGDPANWRHSHMEGGTPGAPNVRSSLVGVFVNELVSKYGDLFSDEHGNYSDWIELYNANSFPVYLMGLTMSDDNDAPSKFTLPYGDPDQLRIPANGYLVLFADANPSLGTRHLDFQLSSGGEDVSVSQNLTGTSSFIDKLSYGPLVTDQSYGRYPDGSDNLTKFDEPTPNEPNKIFDPSQYDQLFINEFVSRYGVLHTDEFGNYTDWIEIYNGSNKVVDIAGLFITDNLSIPTKFRIPGTKPAETTIPSKSFMVLFADAFPNLGIKHLGFQLSSGGEQIGLYYSYADELFVVDSVSFGSLGVDISYGRTVDGGAGWINYVSPTPGSSNNSSSIVSLPSAESRVQVYPIPASENLEIILQVELHQMDDLSIMIYNNRGTLVKDFGVNSNNSGTVHLNWNLKNKFDTQVPAGVYYIIFSGSDLKLARKILVINAN